MKNLKERLREELEELRSDFGDEEVDNALEVLEEQNDDLTSMGKIDLTLLTRLLIDDELLEEVNAAYQEPDEDDFDIFG